MTRRAPSARSATPTARAAPAEPSEIDLRSARGWALLALAFLAISQVVHAPALGGPFLSDDLYYLVANPYVREPTPGNLLAILDPRSDATLMAANYAPAHLLTHALQWQLFGEWMPGYHLWNATLHAANAVLLVALLAGAGLPAAAAVGGGAFFLVHPANVEAVAWVSQVKTQLAMLLMLAALLWRRSRPVAGAVAFGVSLTAKAMAAIALPVAAAQEWARTAADGSRGAARWGPVAAWAAVFAAFAGVQLVAFQHANQSVTPLSDDPWVRVLTSAAIGARYLVMAASGWGVSAFHEPDPVTSPADPWVALAAVAALGLGARTLWALARRREEAAWWLWAAGSFVPVAQVFPFLYPIADRYLYFILPGLIGGALLAGQDVLARLAPERRRAAATAATGLAVAACVVFAVLSFGRAELWTSRERLLADSLQHYPDGATAWFLRARSAALEGDPRRAVEGLRRATASPRRDLDHVLAEPAFAGLRGDPRFETLLRDLARARVDEIHARGRLTEANLLKLAQAHLVLGERREAARIARQILAGDGRFHEHARAILEQAEG